MPNHPDSAIDAGAGRRYLTDPALHARVKGALSQLEKDSAWIDGKTVLLVLDALDRSGVAAYPQQTEGVQRKLDEQTGDALKDA